jgi:hypothetical protein
MISTWTVSSGKVCLISDSSGLTAFVSFIRDKAKLNIETIGGCASFFNGKVERPNGTLAECDMYMIANAGTPAQDWYYATEHAADIYHDTLLSALKCSPYFAWYGQVPNYKDMYIWGCRVIIHARDLNMADNRATDGHLYGFTKSRILL